MHSEALGGGVTEFDAAVEGRVCPYLNQLGEAALGEMRSVYEELDAGNYEALGEIAERLAAAAEQKAATKNEAAAQEQPDKVTSREAVELTSAGVTPSEPAESQAAKVVLVDVRKDLEQAVITQPRDVESKTIAVEELPLESIRQKEREPDVIESVAKPLLEQASAESLNQIAMEQAAHAARINIAWAYEAAEQSLSQQAEVQLPPQITPHAEQRQVDHGEQNSYAPAEAEIAAMVDAIFDEPELLSQDDYYDDTKEPTKTVAILDNVTPSVIDRSERVVQAPEPVTWADELEAKPLKLYKDFTEALHSLIAEEYVPADSEGPAELTEQPVADGLHTTELQPASEPMPAVVVAVAERLDQCPSDKKGMVAPILRIAMETVQTLEALKIEPDIKPEIMETVTAQLEEQIIILFKQLGVEYEAEDIEQFMHVLLRPDFQPPQRGETEIDAVDLEHDGTYEAKRHFVQAVSTGLADVEHEAKRLLGRLILLYSFSDDQRQLAFA